MTVLSIILPVYNAEKFIVKAINSVINQTYKDWELIIVNDGSTDNTLKVIKENFNNFNNIKVIGQKNMGVNAARNQGLKFISGKFVTFIDADDYIDSEMYEKMINQMIATSADIVECGFIKETENNNLLNEFILDNKITKGSYNILKELLLGKNTTNYLCNKIYNRILFKNISIPNFKYSEDYLLNIYLHSNSSIKISISNSFYHYIDNPSSAVNKPFSDEKFDMILAAKAANNFVSTEFPQLSVYTIIYLLKVYMIIDTELSFENNQKPIIKKDFNNIFREYYKGIILSEINYKLKLKFILYFVKNFFLLDRF